MTDSLSSFNSIIDKRFSQIENIKRQYGVVKRLIPNTDSAKVMVKIRNIVDDDLTENENDNDLDEKNWITLLNKTGQRLNVGDTVWIYYWNTITDGYVAIKIGKPTGNVDRKILLERAMAITNSNNVINKTSQTVSSFEIKNKTIRACGNTPPVIYVGGMPAVYYPNVSDIPDICDADVVSAPIYSAKRQAVNDFKQFIIDLDNSLFVKSAKGIYSNYPSGSPYNGVYSKRFYRFDIKYDLFTILLNDDSIFSYLGGYIFTPNLYIKPSDQNAPNWGCVFDSDYTTGSYCREDEKYYDAAYTYWSSLYFTSYSAVMNGGFIFVYDRIYFNDSSMIVPYGFLSGRLVYKSFAPGIFTKQYRDGRIEHSSRYMVRGVKLKESSMSNYCGYMFSPAFISNDEREYARQTLSRTELPPY